MNAFAEGHSSWCLGPEADPKKEEAQVVDDIEHMRRLNNRLWMQILRIALAAAPQETKAVLQDIKNNDRLISGLIEKLADENSRT